MSKVIKSNLLIVHPDCAPVPQGMVVVNKGRVVGVGTEVDVPPNAEVVDCSAYTVMPALIDSHVHITINNRFQLPLSAHFDLDATTAVLRGAMNLRSDLSTGVTTMRTLGDRLGVEKAFQGAIDRGEAVGPRLKVCVRALRPGHGTAPFLCFPADGEEELTLKIRENFSQGADWTKLFITNVRQGDSYEDYIRGDLTDVAAYSRREIDAAIAVSHDLGIPVAAHAIGGPAMRWAMEAGIDSIEHANLLTEEDVALFVKSGAYLSDPNLQLFFDDEVGFASFDTWAWDWWRERVERARELTAKYIPEAVRAGVKVCLGTDSTHATLWREAKELVGLGVSEVDALKAVTTNTAEMLGLADCVGHLSVGMFADVIALDGNPLEDIACLRQVEMVMKEGEVLAGVLGGASDIFSD
ncbi:MAG: amidohydrolase family protein [Gemmatimonadetes bacterium]|nr:amidohydrolase family protein [Gemmatimonadota bacterium]MYF15842.1 amidohydrolase family protein [Gemmatimonadota bacterium]